MRLIDADALYENLDGMMEVSPTGYIHGDAVADMIGDAQTVDAIPVSFIKEQIEKLQGIADYEFIASGGYVGTCNHELGALQDLLKHWTERKEE